MATCAVVQPPRDGELNPDPKSRYQWVPDGDDGVTLIDTQEPVSEAELRAAERNGANNQYWLFTRLVIAVLIITSAM